MKEKVEIIIVELINFGSSFEKKFGTQFKVRNYHIPNYDPQNVYFEFEKKPTADMVVYIKEYAKSIGGTAEFSNDNRQYEILKRPLD